MARETPVGMIGLGLMGSALSARLIDAGIGVIGMASPMLQEIFGVNEGVRSIVRNW